MFGGGTAPENRHSNQNLADRFDALQLLFGSRARNVVDVLNLDLLKLGTEHALQYGSKTSDDTITFLRWNEVSEKHEGIEHVGLHRQKPSFRFEDSVELANGLAQLRDVVKRVDAKDDVEGTVRKLNVSTVLDRMV